MHSNHHLPAIPGTGKLRLEDHKPKPSQGNLVISGLKIKGSDTQ